MAPKQPVHSLVTSCTRNHPVKVGFIGTGGISSTHVPGWKASPHAEIVAGADLNEAGLKAWGEKHGITRLTTNPEDLLADDSIDVIDICTPNMYHTPWVIKALEAGKHVICEKPLAPSLKDKTLSGIRFLVNFEPESSGKTMCFGS